MTDSPNGKLGRWGIGLFLAALTILYSALVMVVSKVVPGHFRMVVVPATMKAIAICLFAIGIPFLLVSLISLHRAYGANRLVTTGIFSLCRNPIYSAWNIFIVPGVVVLLENWLALSIPFAMYVFLRLLINKEENYLMAVFGQEYLGYRRRTFCIAPLSFIKAPKK